MSWSNGSELMERVIDTIYSKVSSSKTRTNIYKELIDAFQDQDWDGVDEVIGIDEAFDRAAEEYLELEKEGY